MKVKWWGLRGGHYPAELPRLGNDKEYPQGHQVLTAHHWCERNRLSKNKRHVTKPVVSDKMGVFRGHDWKTLQDSKLMFALRKVCI